MKLVQGGKGGYPEILIASIGMGTLTESADSVWQYQYSRRRRN